MQCPGCGTIWPDDSAYCSNCGARLDKEALSAAPTVTMQTSTPADPPAPALPQPVFNEAVAPVTPLPGPPVNNPYMEPGWAEFSGTPAPAPIPASTTTPYTPYSPTPGTYTPGNYPYAPGTVPPGFAQPVAPKRRGPLFVTIGILCVLLLISGGVFVGIRIGQTHNGVTSTQLSATPTASPTPDPNHLYQQVTSQNPSFVDELKDPTLSTWSVFEKPTYGCEIKKDGLHVHIKDTGHFGYCTSGQGKLSNFAFQVEMTILSGSGGGVTFRGDNLTGNLYYFHIYPDGNYHVLLEQNDKFSSYLSAGAISSFPSGFDQKFTVTVIAQGDQVYFYINQKFLTKMQDSTYTSGYLGLAASDSTSPAEVVYTNAKIWIL